MTHMTKSFISWIVIIFMIGLISKEQFVNLYLFCYRVTFLCEQHNFFFLRNALDYVIYHQRVNLFQTPCPCSTPSTTTHGSPCPAPTAWPDGKHGFHSSWCSHWFSSCKFFLRSPKKLSPPLSVSHTILFLYFKILRRWAFQLVLV